MSEGVPLLLVNGEQITRDEEGGDHSPQFRGSRRGESVDNNHLHPDRQRETRDESVVGDRVVEVDEQTETAFAVSRLSLTSPHTQQPLTSHHHYRHHHHRASTTANQLPTIMESTTLDWPMGTALRYAFSGRAELARAIERASLETDTVPSGSSPLESTTTTAAVFPSRRLCVEDLAAHRRAYLRPLGENDDRTAHCAHETLVPSLNRGYSVPCRTCVLDDTETLRWGCTSCGLGLCTWCRDLLFSAQHRGSIPSLIAEIEERRSISGPGWRVQLQEERSRERHDRWADDYTLPCHRQPRIPLSPPPRLMSSSLSPSSEENWTRQPPAAMPPRLPFYPRPRQLRPSPMQQQRMLPYVPDQRSVESAGEFRLEGMRGRYPAPSMMRQNLSHPMPPPGHVSGPRSDIPLRLSLVPSTSVSQAGFPPASPAPLLNLSSQKEEEIDDKEKQEKKEEGKDEDESTEGSSLASGSQLSEASQRRRRLARLVNWKWKREQAEHCEM